MNTTQQHNIAIIGASGYTGVELINWLLIHPNTNIHTLVANSNAGNPISSLYPHLTHHNLPDLITLEQANLDDCHIAFCCLPHNTSHEIIKSLPRHLKIIDLSADFRFENIKTYNNWYPHPHSAEDLQPSAVYGLPELYKNKLATANLIACPGCYPTASILPLFPLIKQKLINQDAIIIDAKSGTSGAGRSAKTTLLHTELNENFKAYGIGNHRHTPEIEEKLSLATDSSPIEVTFTPHLLPVSRGILATIYVTLNDQSTIKDLQKAIEEQYQNAPFTRLHPTPPTLQDVTHTNQCLIHISQGRKTNTAIITSAIDNLAKGASTQAIQCMNISLGWEETTGLIAPPRFP